MANKYDVVIIGGGPAGLYAARELENHFNVALIDKKRSIGEYGNRVINKEVLKKLNVDEDHTLQSIDHIDFYSPSALKIETRGKLRGYSINKQKIQEELVSQLTKTDIFLDSTVKEIDFNTDLIKTDKEHFGFTYVLAADGYNSTMRSQLNLGSPSLIKCYMEIWENLEGVTTTIVSNYFAHGFYGWIMPLGNSIEVGIGNYTDPATKLKEFIVNFPIFKQYPKNRTVSKVMGGLIPISIINKKVHNKCILIGDSAGGEPMMGGSIHKAIDEAAIASDVLKKGEALYNYEARWNKKFLQDFSTQQIIRDKLDTLSDGEIDALFKEKQKLQSNGLITGLFKALFSNDIQEVA